MYKMTIAAVLTLMSLPALADSGGFHADEAPPPPHKQHSGYKGSSDAKQVTIKQAKGMKDHAWVTLQGNIEKKIHDDKYLFRDHTDNIVVEIDGDKWNGQEVSPKDLIVVSGKLDKHHGDVKVDVEHVLKQ